MRAATPWSAAAPAPRRAPRHEVGWHHAPSGLPVRPARAIRRRDRRRPGQRTFFLQARSGSRTTFVALEKSQVELFAERVEDLLDEVLRLSGGEAPVPAVAPAALEDLDPLEACRSPRSSGSVPWRWAGTATTTASSSRPMPRARATSCPTSARTSTAPTCCASACRPRRPARSASGPSPSCPQGDRPARSARSRWTRRGTSARVPTATAAGSDPSTPTAQTGETAMTVDDVLEVLARGHLDIEGRLVRRVQRDAGRRLHPRRRRAALRVQAGRR